MNFVLFLMLNAVLLLRPEELFPGSTGLRLYLLTIVPCVLLSLPRLIELLSPSSLRARPVAVCVLLFFASTLVSLCARGRVNEAMFEFGPEFAKVILYYFLLIAVVDTQNRFRLFVATLVILICTLAAVALANHFGVIQFENITPAMETIVNPLTGEEYAIARMVSSGIFNDPNDLCLVLGLGILCCIYSATQSSLGVVGWALWLAPVPVFVYALLETHSRGGLLGVMAGVGAYFYSRFGGPKSLPYVIGGGVAALMLIGGRQGSMEGGGTAHQRVMAWAEGFTALFREPWFLPIGLGHGWYEDETGLVAHNSFVQAYVEEGVFGGAAFLGAFFFGVWLLSRFGRAIDVPTWAMNARDFAFAALVGYALGCYSITRNFVVPTYLVLGLASVLLEQAAPTLPRGYQVDGRWLRWFAVVGLIGLVLMALAIKGMGQAGI